MKKYRVLCLLLALCLLASLCSGVWADELSTEAAEEDSAVEDEDSAAEDPEETEAPKEDADDSDPYFRDYSSVLIREEPYEVNCKSALLIEMSTNTVLFAEDAYEQRYPASLTKIMTCLVAIETCASRGKSLDGMVTVSASALEGLDDGGSTAGIQPGDIISLRELLYCMMLESANESCNIVAEYLAGDVSTYVGWMNEKAKELGCTGTHYANTHGLHDPNHYTTARDLALITEAALQNEEFTEIMSRATYTVKAENYSGKRDIATTNMLLLEYSDYYYSLARGVKTGYTSAAGRCLITTASDSNLRLLVIILGAEDNDYAEDGLRYRSFVEAKNLLKYGFANFDYAQVISKLDMTAQVVVSGGDANSVVLCPSEDVNCLLPEGYDKEQVTQSWSLYDGATRLEAPLEARQKVGTITVYYKNVEIGKTTLETLTEVKQLNSVETVVAGTGNFFKNTLPELLRQYWWIFPAVLGLIAFLLLVLIVRNNLIRRKRREQMRRKKQQQQRKSQV